MFALAALAGSGSLGGTCQGQSQGSGVQKEPQTSGAEVSIQGVDTSALTPREKREWGSYVSEFLSPCSDTPVSIAQCVQEKRNCSRCLPAAKFILKGVRDGQSREQLEKITTTASTPTASRTSRSTARRRTAPTTRRSRLSSSRTSSARSAR